MNNYRYHQIIGFSLLTFALTTQLYGETYRVVKGDTLYSIARNYHVSVKELMSLNNISDPSSLAAGMDLVIPGTESAPAADSYKVVRGDTYYSISRKYGMEVDELLRLNGLSVNDVLSIGQNLAVSGMPSEEKVDTTPEKVPPEEPVTTGTEGREKGKTTVPSAVPALTYGRTGKGASRPEWPVAGDLYSVDGDFEGVMIESSPSSYVEAVAEGEVVWAGPYWEFGEIVLIENEGFIYFYGGNSDIFVNVGQKISVGTRVGRLDNVDGKGNLYFTVFKEGKVIDLAMAGN
ncbi:MAG: M23 family metallopeptidase [Spirochaetales bacterium]|nr:M23 family metallopeptidase [Spirochaetales bacterium]